MNVRGENALPGSWKEPQTPSQAQGTIWPGHNEAGRVLQQAGEAAAPVRCHLRRVRCRLSRLGDAQRGGRLKHTSGRRRNDPILGDGTEQTHLGCSSTTQVCGTGGAPGARVQRRCRAGGCSGRSAEAGQPWRDEPGGPSTPSARRAEEQPTSGPGLRQRGGTALTAAGQGPRSGRAFGEEPGWEQRGPPGLAALSSASRLRPPSLPAQEPLPAPGPPAGALRAAGAPGARFASSEGPRWDG